MFVTHKESISQADYIRYKDAAKEESAEFFKWRGHFSAYPPAGYGMYGPRVEIIDGNYYAVWERSDNCD